MRDFVDFYLLLVLVEPISNFVDIAVAQRTSCSLLQPSDQTEEVKFVLTRLGFALVNKVFKADCAAFGGFVD